MSSASSACVRHRCRNSQTWQWPLSVSRGGSPPAWSRFTSSEHLLRLAVELRVQPDLAQPGLRAAGDQPDGGPQPLHAGEDQPEHGQQDLLLPADLVPVVVEDGDVVVVPQLRGPVRPLQGVEAERQALVLKVGVRQAAVPPASASRQ